MDKILTEAVKLRPGQQWLTDSLTIRLSLVEDGTSGGKLIVRGEFARSGRATENKRLYPRDLWEREIAKLSQSMAERKVMGELDHPNDGRTSLQRASHLVLGMELRGDGVVLGEAEVMDTAKGKDLAAMLRAGARVGVSSRGYGSTRTNEAGEEVVQEDYNLVTFDFVAEPADNDAFPDVYSESKEFRMASEAQKREDQRLSRRFAAHVQAEAEAKAKAEDAADSVNDEAAFEAEIISNLGKLSSTAREKIRAEMLADPVVGRAKQALEQIKDVLRPFVLPEDAKGVVAEKDAEISRLQNRLSEQQLKMVELGEQIDSLMGMAREASYKYFLERALGGHPDQGLVLKVVGDLSQYESADVLKAKVSSVLEELDARRAAHAEMARQEEARQDEARKAAEQSQKTATAQVESYKVELDKLASALEKTLEANKELGVQLYTESRLRNHPDAASLRPLLEATRPRSKEAVEKLLEDHREPVRDPDDLEQTRARVRRLTNGGRGATPLEEETSPTSRAREERDYNNLGVDLGTLRALSGIKSNGRRPSY